MKTQNNHYCLQSILSVIWTMAFAISLASCQRDFDELIDTDQRSMSFVFNTHGFFSKVLSTTNDGFALGQDTVLDDRHRLRFVTFCYNSQEKLVEKNTIFSSPNQPASITIKHLHKDSLYRFIFVADVVDYNSTSDYVERWFALDADNPNQLYLTSLELDGDAKYNVLKMDTITAFPDNQTFFVPFYEITSNGFCIFQNTSNIDKVGGYVSRYISFRARSQKGITRGTAQYYFYPSTQSEYIFPVTTSKADNEHTVCVITQSVSSVDTNRFTLSNRLHRSFVISIDCQTKSLINRQYY